MPIRALYEIQAFSKPMTRPDWRTCKAEIASCIHRTDAESKLYFPYTIPCNQSLPTVNMYARLKALGMFNKPQERFILWA